MLIKISFQQIFIFEALYYQTITEANKEIPILQVFPHIISDCSTADLVNSIADEDEADNINCNEYKEELLQLRQLNQKKKRENIIMNERL